MGMPHWRKRNNLYINQVEHLCTNRAGMSGGHSVRPGSARCLAAETILWNVSHFLSRFRVM
jgi:hypothetical protein